MKKYSVLLAIIALVLASLACRTVMGGGSAPQQMPPTNGGGIEEPLQQPTVPPAATEEGGGGFTTGGESPFPKPSDAFNVITAPDTLMYQTKMSSDDVIKFYQDELEAQGFTEDTSVTTNFNGIIAMSFKGDGKTIVIGGAPLGDGSISVTVTYQK